MNKALIRIYSTYGLIIFAGALILLYPLFIVAIWLPGGRSLGLLMNKLWARMFLTLSLIPPQIKWKSTLEPDRQYIFVGNHTSYLDIVLMGYVPRLCVFVGKKSLSKVPIFGYMFRNLHITVDRSNPRSRYQVFEEGSKVLDDGYSLVMFPEGGIRSTNPPNMASFRNGAFKLAITKNVSIVPVTMPHNWRIQPGDNRMIMHPEKPLAIFHKPIDTKLMQESEADLLKNQVFNIIDSELRKYYPKLAEQPISYEN